MYFSKWDSLGSILDKSPFFKELSMKEQERLIDKLLKQYPQLSQQYNKEIEMGYEAGWLTDRLQ
jgi:hypothetical protein